VFERRQLLKMKMHFNINLWELRGHSHKLMDLLRFQKLKP